MDQLQDKIILIEGKQTDHPSFFLSLKKRGYNVEIASTGNSAIEKIQESDPMIVLIDAASMRTASNRIVYRIKKRNPDLPIILIIDEMLKQKKISDKADLVLCLPFTVQKLLNRIMLFAPAKKSTLKCAGDLALDTSRNCIYIDNRVVGVTPRVSKLLNLFMDRPGEIIKREELFRELWDTDYLEDMRSLDVHIQWLRKAIEENPKNPQYLITVKGQGYMLEPNGNGKNKKIDQCALSPVCCEKES
ncbi:MAG TPA: response regulator transcription factor [Flexilinea sp.]|nr:response regulator transcription factor [Flexilinea sp.]HOP00820.1 response regulator transcription factor [Flexilinea sp.]HOU18758.1 response regulator transcription factor [Flexilinea sp.]HPB39234.1 response regulator transcription factor [Flexilinea sp.]HPJ65942.1 response regulator transcription factor [Flexilinea sp.]